MIIRFDIVPLHFSLVVIYLIAIGCNNNTIEAPVTSSQSEDTDGVNFAHKESSEEDPGIDSRKIKSQIKPDSNSRKMLAHTLVDIYFETEDFRPPSSFVLVLTNESKVQILADLENELRQINDEGLSNVAEFIQAIRDLQTPPTPQMLNEMVESNGSIKMLIEKVDQAHFRYSMQTPTAKADAPMRTVPEKTPPKSPPSSAGSDLITNSIGMKLKLIPAGEFLMGSPADEADRYDREGPQHKVRITKPFYMGVTEVTQGEWFSVMKTKPWNGKLYVKEGDAYPATYVSWYDAVAYCQELSATEGKEYRLPTESEWEYACRGGKSTSYSFGGDAAQLSSYAWFAENAWDIGEEYAHEVGGKQPNPFGLYDMHGNVWEWCSDWFGSYSASAAVDPQGLSIGSLRGRRGGGWDGDAGDCRAARRSALVPWGRSTNFGFRLALSSSGE